MNAAVRLVQPCSPLGCLLGYKAKLGVKGLWGHGMWNSFADIDSVEQTTERMLKWGGQHMETEKTSDDLNFELAFFVDEHCINVGLVPNRSQVDCLPCLCFLKSPSNCPGVRRTSPLHKRMFGQVIRVYPSKA
ncbi:hypothetical protein AAG906_008837 [Vitis piasezkii]